MWKHLIEDYITGILRTEDAFMNVMDRKEFALFDIVDGSNVIYKGRGGILSKSLYSEGSFHDNYIENCVFLRHSGDEGDQTFLYTELCRASEFLCHEVNTSRNERTLQRKYSPPPHCVSDHQGYSFRGNLSKSVSGLPCLPWKNFTSFELWSTIEVNEESKNIFLRVFWLRWNTTAPEFSHLQNWWWPSGPLNEDPNTKLTKKALLPDGFLINGNECRNKQDWPLFVADTVCVVERHRRRVLEVCAPPLCAKNRGQMKTTLAPTRTGTMDFFCNGDTKMFFTYHTFGMVQHSRIRKKSHETIKHCFDVNYGAYIVQAVLFSSFLLNIFILIFLWRNGMWNLHKYSHLSYLNLMNVILVVGFAFFVWYSTTYSRVQLISVCIVKLQILSISLQLYFLAVICVGIDCAIAVLYPLRHHVLSSKKLFICINVGVLATLLITQMLLPLVHALITTPAKRLHCESQVFQSLSKYFIGNHISSVILLVAACSVNMTIVTGVGRSLIKRKEMLSKKEGVVKKMFKLVFRIICLLAGNYGCLSFIFLYSFGISEKNTPPTIILSASLSVGIWNNIIYVFLDENIRNRLTCRHKNIGDASRSFT